MNALDQQTRLYLVVLEPEKDSTRLLHHVKQKAKMRNTSLQAIAIGDPSLSTFGLRNKEKFQRILNLTKQMGVTINFVRGTGAIKQIRRIIAQKEEEGYVIDSINFGVERQPSFFQRLGAPLFKRLASSLDKAYSIQLIYLDSYAINSQPFQYLLKINLKDIFYSLLAVLFATLGIELLHLFWPESMPITQAKNKAIIYMIACAYSASRYGLVCGILAAVTSFLVMGVLYIQPYGGLVLNDVNDALSLGLFLTAAAIIALFGSRDHQVKHMLRRRMKRLESLLQMHHITIKNQTPKEAIKALDENLSHILETEVVFFLPSPTNPRKLSTLFNDELKLSKQDEATLQTCWDECKTTGAGTVHHSDANWRFEPLIAAEHVIGVIGVFIKSPSVLTNSYSKLLSSIADQAALIIERIELGYIAEESRVQAEREKLRSMLLSSVSHDLKTPLASVIGSLSVFRSMGTKLPEQQQITLIDTALQEAQRLDSFITNILDMTRLESGQVELKEEWVDVARMTQDVAKRLKNRLASHKLMVVSNESFDILADDIMTAQVLQNLLDNAVKYTKAGTQIDVGWHVQDGKFELFVRDHGEGIREDKLDKIFDKYERIHKQDNQVAGTGLGLSIAKTVMLAQGGDITVHNHPQGGAIFTMKFNQWRAGTSSKEEAA